MFVARGQIFVDVPPTQRHPSYFPCGGLCELTPVEGGNQKNRLGNETQVETMRAELDIHTGGNNEGGARYSHRWKQ